MPESRLIDLYAQQAQQARAQRLRDATAGNQLLASIWQGFMERAARERAVAMETAQRQREANYQNFQQGLAALGEGLGDVGDAFSERADRKMASLERKRDRAFRLTLQAAADKSAMARGEAERTFRREQADRLPPALRLLLAASSGGQNDYLTPSVPDGPLAATSQPTSQPGGVPTSQPADEVGPLHLQAGGTGSAQLDAAVPALREMLANYDVNDLLMGSLGFGNIPTLAEKRRQVAEEDSLRRGRDVLTETREFNLEESKKATAKENRTPAFDAFGMYYNVQEAALFEATKDLQKQKAEGPETTFTVEDMQANLRPGIQDAFNLYYDEMTGPERLEVDKMVRAAMNFSPLEGHQEYLDAQVDVIARNRFLVQSPVTGGLPGIAPDLRLPMPGTDTSIFKGMEDYLRERRAETARMGAMPTNRPPAKPQDWNALWLSENGPD